MRRLLRDPAPVARAWSSRLLEPPPCSPPLAVVCRCARCPSGRVPHLEEAAGEHPRPSPWRSSTDECDKVEPLDTSPPQLSTSNRLRYVSTGGYLVIRPRICSHAPSQFGALDLDCRNKIKQAHVLLANIQRHPWLFSISGRSLYLSLPWFCSVLYMISTVSPSHCFPAAADHMEHVRTPPATVVYASSDILGLNPAQPIRPLCAC